jgi:hypothetical protein
MRNCSWTADFVMEVESVVAEIVFVVRGPGEPMEDAAEREVAVRSELLLGC